MADRADVAVRLVPQKFGLGHGLLRLPTPATSQR
jgi:hypothetical protein